MLLFPDSQSSFPEYPFRKQVAAWLSLGILGPREGGKGDRVAWIRTIGSARQKAEAGLRTAPPSARFEFCPMGPNLWALQLWGTQARAADNLIDDGCSHLHPLLRDLAD